MCGKVISGADYEQINSFGGGDFSNGQQIFHHEPNRRNTKKAAALMPRPKPFRRPNGFRTNLLTARRPNGFRTIRSDRFRTVVRTYFGRLPGGVSDCHSEGFRPTVRTNPGPLPGGISGRHPGQISGPRTDSGPPSVRTHNSDTPPPRKSHRKADGIPGGATCGRNRLTQTSGSAAPPTCIRLSAPAPRRTRARK